MQTNTTRFFEEWNGIKANPMLDMLRRVRFITLCAIIINLAVCVSFFLLPIEGQHPPLPIWAPFNVMIIGFILAMNSAQERYWKRIEQQRFAIAQGDRTLLAAEQPMLNVTSIQLPLTIKWRYTKESVLLTMGWILLMALFFAGASSLYGPGPWFFISNALLSFLANFFLCAGVLFLVIIFPVIIGLGRPWVKVTESGITVRYGGKTGTVMWEEARLLTMYDMYRAQKSRAAITYELSSATDIVRWTWIRHKTYFVGMQPTVPLDEHNRQMQELLALVEAKTGLALYYLRH